MGVWLPVEVGGLRFSHTSDVMSLALAVCAIEALLSQLWLLGETVGKSIPTVASYFQSAI